nr:MAG TPA: hypothetical protein [Caudoviricetes sp.]
MGLSITERLHFSLIIFYHLLTGQNGHFYFFSKNLINFFLAVSSLLYFIKNIICNHVLLSLYLYLIISLNSAFST